MRVAFRVLAGLVAIGAGVYLLGFSSTAALNLGGSSGKSWFEIIDHGLGAYFVARGIWMCASAGVHDDALVKLSRLVELREWEVSNTFQVDDEADAAGARPTN